jgi:hypothetical protein
VTGIHHFNTWRTQGKKTITSLGALSVLSLSLSLGVTGCVSAPSTEPTPTKEAFQLSRDVQLCFENATGGYVTISWQGVDSSTGQGDLPAGKQYCGVAEYPDATVIFQNGFKAYVKGSNLAVGYPSVTFVDVATKSSNYHIYAQAYYAIDETVNSDVEGHQFSVTRGEDTDYINFYITVLE